MGFWWALGATGRPWRLLGGLLEAPGGLLVGTGSYWGALRLTGSLLGATGRAAGAVLVGAGIPWGYWEVLGCREGYRIAAGSHSELLGGLLGAPSGVLVPTGSNWEALSLTGKPRGLLGGSLG